MGRWAGTGCVEMKGTGWYGTQAKQKEEVKKEQQQQKEMQEQEPKE